MEKFKDVLKFDSGADGFIFMIRVLALCAVLVLILGTYFILKNFNLETL